MRKALLFLAAIIATSGFVLRTTRGEAQSRVRMAQQLPASDLLRRQKIAQLRKEAEHAERGFQRQVKWLERFEKSATFIKKGADAAIEAGPKIALDAATKTTAVGIAILYKGVTKSILDPQGVERRRLLHEQSRARREEERLKKQKWQEDFTKRQEEFNKKWRLPQINNDSLNGMSFQER